MTAPITTTKTALVTGVSRPLGLGFAVSRQLAELGYHVVLTARDAAQAELLATQLRQDNVAATALYLDLTDRASINHAAAHIAGSFGRLDVLINNASIVPDRGIMSALDADPDYVRAALEIDVIGPWSLIQVMLPLVNAVDPGETASHPERGDDGDDRPAAESARGVVWAATLDEDGTSGGFFRDGRSLT